jgi:chitodextrinase
MMRFYILLLTTGVLFLSGESFCHEGSGGQTEPHVGAEKAALSSLLSKAQYDSFFPHHHALYTYEAFLKASATYPLFAGEGDSVLRRRELAAFFAEIAHETTDGGPESPGGPYAWGLFYTEELGCQNGGCKQYNTGGDSRYRPAPGKSYYGRGPIQLSYAYNYGLAGEELGLPLLAQPELVSHDGVIAFRTALWFWMKAQAPIPSCHDVMVGKWQPDAEDRKLGRRPGFGMTINIINGAVECKSKAPAIRANRENRIGYYRYFADRLRTPVEKDCDCSGMASYKD